MPGYVAKALKQFQHMKPKKDQHAPFPCVKINYDAERQFATQASTAPVLDKKSNYIYSYNKCEKIPIRRHTVRNGLHIIVPHQCNSTTISKTY